MAQPSPSKFRLTQHQTNEMIFRLEERKYGQRLNSQQLAQKADISLDFVNRVEKQEPFEDPHALERISIALGITPELLRKIAGFEEITQDEWVTLHNCLPTSPPGQPVPTECERLGFRRLWK